MWVAAAGYTTDQWLSIYSPFFSSLLGPNSNVQTASSSMQAAMAFDWLLFILRASNLSKCQHRSRLISLPTPPVLAHVVMLLTLALLYQNRGMSVWMKSINDVASVPVPSSASGSSLSKPYSPVVTAAYTQPEHIAMHTAPAMTYSQELPPQGYTVNYNHSAPPATGSGVIQV